MLTAVFRSVLGTSLSVLPVVLPLFFLQPVLGRRYAPGLRYFLWLAVAARLLLPVSMPDIARFLLPAGERVYILETDSAAVLRALAEAEAAFDGAVPQAAAGSGTQALPLMTILAAVWLAGVAVFLLFQAAAYRAAARRLRRWCVPVGDADTLALFEGLRKELGIRRRVGLHRCQRVSAPMLMGFVSPRVILPAGDVDVRYLRAVLCHELTHYRRRDLWYKLVIMVARALHWFNPAVALMARRAEADMELCCDREVLSRTDSAARRQYGYAVLSYAKAEPGRRTPLATCFQSGKRQMKQRMMEIMDTKIKKKGAAPMGMAVAAILISAALISCGEGPAQGERTAPAAVPEVSVAESRDEYGRLNEELERVREQNSAVEAMKAQYLTDLEKNKALQDKAKAELDEIYEALDYPDRLYAGGEMIWPVPGHYKILSKYGSRFGGSDFHTGMDIHGLEDCYGAPAVAAQEGAVAFVNTEYTPGVGYGIYIILDHGGGLSTLYGHLSEIDVKAGDPVEKGQVIGKIGATGWAAEPHLHFEVRLENKHVEPAQYLIGE